MFGKKSGDVNSQSFEASNGAKIVHGTEVNASSGGQATVRIEHSPSGRTGGIYSAILVAVIGAVVGAYATHLFGLLRAPTQTVENAETVLGIAKSALEIAQRQNASPVLVAKLEDLSSQTQALQATAQLMQRSGSGISFQVDLWFPIGRVGLLDGHTFLIKEYGINDKRMRALFDGGYQYIQDGEHFSYETETGKKCDLTLMTPSPDGRLLGFRQKCKEKDVLR